MVSHHSHIRNCFQSSAAFREAPVTHALVMNACRLAPPNIDLNQCGNRSASGRCDRPDQTLAMGGSVGGI
jgi:hypothetical protein